MEWVVTAGDYASRFTVEKLVELIGKSGKEPVAIMKSADFHDEQSAF